MNEDKSAWKNKQITDWIHDDVCNWLIDPDTIKEFPTIVKYQKLFMAINGFNGSSLLGLTADIISAFFKDISIDDAIKIEEDRPMVKQRLTIFYIQDIKTLKIIICCLSVCFFFFFVFLRGNILLKSFANIQYCSGIYFFVYVLGIVIQLTLSALIFYILIKEATVREYNAFENISSGYIRYDLTNCFLFSALGMAIGLGSILFGLGGGSITNPLLIMSGFDPLHAVATSVALMEITSVSSIVNYTINGFLIYEYAIYVGLTVIVTTCLALLLLNFILERFKRTSFISFFMATFFLLSFIIVITRIVNIARTESNIFAFSDYCSPSSYTHKMAH